MMNTASFMDVRPPMASYSPSIWGYIFTTFSLDDQMQKKYAEAIEVLKKEARSMLMAATSSKLMILVDALERLGLAYHFEAEIEEKLQEIEEDNEDYDLFTTALRFRLLRQHRYHVSCSAFEKFKDDNGYKFRETLVSDIEGLLSLYEAANVQMHGEDMLEDAVAFASHHLAQMLPKLKSPLKHKVKQALEQPLHRGVAIMQIRFYISVYEEDETRNELLLKLSKLNFNYLHNLYRKELCELSRWWNKFDLKSKLPYARDRLVEGYIWGAAFQYEPHYSHVRIAITKSIVLVTILDDTYDNYATLKEAQLFTDILVRWNKDEIDRLPDYMKIVYHFILSIDEDYERDAAKQGKWFAVPYFKEAVKQLGKAYNQEQKRVMERQMPSFEEYIKNSVITSCIYVMLPIIIPGLTSVTKETIDWLLNAPKLSISTAEMGRYYNDLGTHERENKGGKMLTAVDCYMKQHGVSKQEALSNFAEQIEDAWKNVYTGWVTSSSSMHKEMIQQHVNYARITEVTYKNSEDGYTNPDNNLAPYIVALFVDPIVI